MRLTAARGHINTKSPMDATTHAVDSVKSQTTHGVDEKPVISIAVAVNVI